MHLKRYFSDFVQSYIEEEERNSILYWKQVVFYTVFFISFVIGMLAYLMGVIYAISIQAPLIFAVETLLNLSMGLTLFHRKIPYRIKSHLLPLFPYLIGSFLLFSFGPGGDGRTWLVLFVFLCALFTCFPYALFSALLVFFTDLFIRFVLQPGVLHQETGLLQFPLLGAGGLVSALNTLILLLIIIVALHYFLGGVEQAIKRINKSRVATISGLAKLAEFRDSDTGSHLERISQFSVALAQEMRKKEKYKHYLTRGYIQDLAVSSILHDIGKVGIPDTILLKPGKLTPEEFERVKEHTVIGARVIDVISKKIEDAYFLKMARHIALHHHERWDGKGYPQGLKGEDIPLSARIVALVDVYDALISKRVYKDAISLKEALTIIKKGRGTMFDPELTDIFLRLHG